MLIILSRLFCIFILFINFGATCPSYPTPIPVDQSNIELQNAYNQIDSLIQLVMEQNEIKGFIATIVYLDEIVWSKTYGNLNPLDPTTPFLTIDSNIKIASCTKIFTDLMMFKLRDDKLLSLDDEISNYWPVFKINSIYNTNRGITFRELSSHQSGLPREVPCETFYYGTSNCTEQIILDKLSKQFLILPQYFKTHYSNLGVSLLGRVLGEIISTNKTSSGSSSSSIDNFQEPYVNYVENEIIIPLGLNSTTFNIELIKDNLAIGLIKLANGTFVNVPESMSGWNIPSGGLYSTGRDVSKFMIFWLNGNESMLDSSTHNEALQPVSLVNDGLTSYGTPFEMYYQHSTNMWLTSKAGIANGYRSQIAMATHLKLGVFFHSLYSFTTPDLFTRDALNILIPVYLNLLHSQQAEKQQQAEEKVEVEDDTISFSSSIIIGNYTNEFGNIFSIFNVNGSLVGNFGDTPNFYIIPFDDYNFPYIKRMVLTNPKQILCLNTVDGSDNELIYFQFNDNNNNQSIALQIMGETLFKNKIK